MSKTTKPNKIQARREILARIAQRLLCHNFSGESLDDCWVDHVSGGGEALDYLTNEEIKALEATTTEDEENTNAAACDGEQVVLHEFVIFLCNQYEVTSEELAHRHRLQARGRCPL